MHKLASIKLVLILVLMTTGKLLSQTHITSQSNLPDTIENYYDFWVGVWDVTWDEGNGKMGKGSNRVEKILNGKVIQENFQITVGNGEDFKGISLSTYNKRQKEWQQTWVDNQGGYYNFHGQIAGEKRIFITDVIEKGHEKFLSRMVFKDIEKDSFTWDWESSSDAGNTWTLKWRIFYKRKASD